MGLDTCTCIVLGPCIHVFNIREKKLGRPGQSGDVQYNLNYPNLDYPNSIIRTELESSIRLIKKLFSIVEASVEQYSNNGFSGFC